MARFLWYLNHLSPHQPTKKEKFGYGRVKNGMLYSDNAKKKYKHAINYLYDPL